MGAALLLLHGTAIAVSKEFNNGIGDWNVADNWTPAGVPGDGDRANIRDGDTVNVTDSPPATDVTLDGGTITVEGDICAWAPKGISRWLRAPSNSTPCICTTSPPACAWSRWRLCFR